MVKETIKAGGKTIVVKLRSSGKGTVAIFCKKNGPRFIKVK